MLVFQRCSSISFVGSGDYTLALRKKGACSRQVPFLYNKDAPERRTLPIFPDQRSITCEHRYRYRQGSARGHLVRTRERHLLHHREKIRAVQRRLQLRRVQDMAGGHDAPGAHRRERRRAGHRRRHRRCDVHRGAREASAPYPVHRSRGRDAGRGPHALCGRQGRGRTG